MRFKTWQLLAILLLSVFVPMATIIGFAQSDTSKGAVTVSHREQHRTKDFYANVRVLPPATVTEIDGNRVYYSYVDEGINLGSLELEPGYSIVPKDFAAKHGACYGMYFCEVHKVILNIDELDPKLCRLQKH